MGQGDIEIGSRVRSTNDGQRGVVVQMEETGGLGVRLDRRGENRVVPYNAQQWEPDREPTLTPIQVARVFYDADRALKIARGAYASTLPEWIGLRDEERRAWLDRKRWQPVQEFMWGLR